MKIPNFKPTVYANKVYQFVDTNKNITLLIPNRVFTKSQLAAMSQHIRWYHDDNQGFKVVGHS